MADAKELELVTEHVIQPEQDMATAMDDVEAAPAGEEAMETPIQSEEATVAALAGVRNQDDLERSIGRQADAMLLKQADERDQKRLEKAQRDKARLEGMIRQLEKKLTEFGNHATKTGYRNEIQHYKAQITTFDTDISQITARMEERARTAEAQNGDTLMDEAANKRQPGESQRDFLIRTGKITPFSKFGQHLLNSEPSLGNALMDAELEEHAVEQAEKTAGKAGPVSHRNLRAPGFDQDESEDEVNTDADAKLAPRLQDQEKPGKRRRLPSCQQAREAPKEAKETAAGLDLTDADAKIARQLQAEEDASARPAKRRRLRTRRQAQDASSDVETPADSADAAYTPEIDEDGLAAIGQSADELEESDADAEEGDFALDTAPAPTRKGKSQNKKAKAIAKAAKEEDLAGIDDGNERVYQNRLESWVERRSAARKRQLARQESTQGDEGVSAAAAQPTLDGNGTEETHEEWHLAHPNRLDTELENGLRIPGDIYPSLFDYQKTGVQWLDELYAQQVGGIIGDEMGLGKTIQVIAFLAGLHYSKKLTKPIIVVTPATVMKQWVNEFHRWWPPLRVSILHTSGSGMLNVSREAAIEDELDDTALTTRRTVKSNKSASRIVNKVIKDGHVLVTTYSGLQTYAELLIPTKWEYAVLDEGHKIRNPHTDLTQFCKELKTHNRIILSGTPMQNNLTELWSLFDFVYPMRLGTLTSFKTQFDIPIKQGGYGNASNLQIESAAHTAETLKDAISPYLLQRFKLDVASDLPKKTEQVLFCRLTKPQRNAYETFLRSDDMKSILDGKRNSLFGIDILRKICNHPDLAEHKMLTLKEGYNYGSGVLSGKMQVVKDLLNVWKEEGHKTLLFAQHRIMLDILEKFIRRLDGINYLRMDGNTSIKNRQDLVDQFNNDPDMQLFLLTTKVGGLGVNLTGADRVIIYDPDWNPSTDAQARERAWRLGQKREVNIYRLIMAGTIEEKIFHRQIFKQFLSNKVLKDPKQRQTFQLKDLHDLFTLGTDRDDGETETSSIFQNSRIELTGKATQPDQDGLPTPPEENGTSNVSSSIGNMAGIARSENYQPSEEEKQQDQAKQASANDNRMLSSIFARSGVSSAVEHDAIFDPNAGNNTGKKRYQADPAAIQREAKRVAAEAARELKRAGEVARTIEAGVPTWTGERGSAGRPPSPPPRHGGYTGWRGRGASSLRGRGNAAAAVGGPSSTAVLANLQARQAGTTPRGGSGISTPQQRGGGHGSRTGTPSRQQNQQQTEQDLPHGKDFIALIRDYLLAHGGRVFTQMLIDHFNRIVGKDRQRQAEFTAMLRTIADKEGGRSGGRATWTLKEEFKPGAGGGGGSGGAGGS